MNSEHTELKRMNFREGNESLHPEHSELKRMTVNNNICLL